MTMDAAYLSIMTFKVEQKRLSDLLTGTDTYYQRIPISEQQPTVAVHPDSREAKVRARVLPSNPYFKEYARQAREVLGLPLNGVDQCESVDFAESIAPIGIDSRITPCLWAAWWLSIHLVKSELTGPRTVQGLPPLLPQWLHEYGLQDQVIAIPETDWPHWTERNPRYPASEPTTSERAPIDTIAGLFLSAFNLPSRCFEYIRWYILTNDETFLDVGGNPLEVDIDAPIGPDRRVRPRITIDGLDSSTAKADWDQVWDRRIAPFLKALHINEVQIGRWDAGEELGGTHLDDLLLRGRSGHKPGMKIPDYARFYEFRWDRQSDDLAGVLTSYMENFPEDPSVNANTDPRTLKTNVDRLESIMRTTTVGIADLRPTPLLTSSNQFKIRRSCFISI